MNSSENFGKENLPNRELRIMTDIAKQASVIIMGYFNKQLDVQIKNDDKHNFLTIADLESDAFIRNALAEAFPRDQILSEESSDRPTDFSGRVWMVDPLDGTKEFLNKGTRFSVMIGLCENGVPIAGIVSAPAAQLEYWGYKDSGSFRSIGGGPRERLRVNSEINSIDDARMIVRLPYGESRPSDAFIESIDTRENIGDASIGLKFGRIAAREADFSVNTNKRGSKWDTCAPQIILEEAGGIVTDIFGEPLDYKSPSLAWGTSFVASSNIVLHKRVIERIKGLEQLL